MLTIDGMGDFPAAPKAEWPEGWIGDADGPWARVLYAETIRTVQRVRTWSKKGSTA